MARDVMIVAGCAAATYAWLCATVAPIASGVGAAARLRSPVAWSALALATGGAIVWTFIAAAALFIVMMLQPRVGLALVGGSAWLPGVVAGAACWIWHGAATRRLPRIGSDFEVATALAIVALVNDDPATLSRVEGLYREHAAHDAVRTTRFARRGSHDGSTVLGFYGSGGSNARTAEPQNRRTVEP
jgi:hypothetical protein